VRTRCGHDDFAPEFAGWAIIDVQSTTRVEFLDRYADGECDAIPFSSAHRPGEAACARVADAMLRRLRAIGRSPVTGAPLAAAICTGDNTDNQQENELDVFLAVMDGGSVTPQSGNPEVYEGVQASGDVAYWHPDPAIADGYKTGFGFPDAPGFLEDALAPFEAVGAGVPWYTCYGNHDGLIQGNVPVFPGLQELAAGPVKPYGLPPGTNPCDPLLHIGELPSFPAEPVTPDPGRRAITRGEWIAGHLDSPGLPAGHGFGPDNLEGELAYYAADVGPLRWLVLDAKGDGEAQDRNVELLLAHPFAPEAEGPPPTSPGTTDLPPVPVPQPGPPTATLPATGIPPNLTVGGALLLAGAVGTRELRRRAEQVRPTSQPPG
jgi:hypothetical protein